MSKHSSGKYSIPLTEIKTQYSDLRDHPANHYDFDRHMKQHIRYGLRGLGAFLIVMGVFAVFILISALTS